MRCLALLWPIFWTGISVGQNIPIPIPPDGYPGIEADSEALAGCPDLNGNGSGEILSGDTETNEVLIWDGLTLELLHRIGIESNGFDVQFGLDVAPVPDIDGDGVSEIAVGSIAAGFLDPPQTPFGRVYLYSGFDGTFIRSFRSSFENPNDDFGVCIVGIGDYNGNGAGDLLVGGGVPVDLPDRPRAEAFDGLTGELLFTLQSPRESIEGSSWFGHKLSPVPDTNGDGKQDIIVGAEGEDLDSQMTGGAGLAYLFDGSNQQILHVFVSPNIEDGGHFGFDVSGVPDTNGDGLGDVVIGARSESNGGYESRNGRAYVFDGFTGDLLLELESPQDTDRTTLFGEFVFGIPDATGNGSGDVVIVARDGGPTGDGEAYLFDGRSGVLNRTFSGFYDEGFVWPAAVVPDLNGDGLVDFVFGPGWSKRGQSYLYHSIALSPSSVPNWIQFE